jgi:hypothetical protein
MILYEVQFKYMSWPMLTAYVVTRDGAGLGEAEDLARNVYDGWVSPTSGLVVDAWRLRVENVRRLPGLCAVDARVLSEIPG